MADDAARAPAPQSGTSSGAGWLDGGPVRILVVEDRPVARRLLQDELAGSEEFKIIGEAKNGEEGVRLAAELEPDVIIMDVVMPKMDGITATAQIRKTSQVPIVMLSGSRQDADTLAYMAKKRGANAFLLKPSGPVSVDLYKIRDELLDTIRRVVRERD